MTTELEKKVLSPGNNTDYPKVGDEVTIEYTGWLYDASKASQDFKGNKFDSSVGRKDFKTQIGVGRVIQGWDQGVPQMSLGEKSRLTIPGSMAYGERGFPGLIPKDACLIFDVHLKGINSKSI